MEWPGCIFNIHPKTEIKEIVETYDVHELIEQDIEEKIPKIK
jgi:hypothetical protein